MEDEEADLRFRHRLVKFYSVHNPAKLASIDALQSKYDGDEEALIQKIHLKYGVRDLVSDVAVDDVFENERYSFLNMTFGSTFLTYPGHLMVVDRKRWSAASGSPSSQEMHDVEPTLPDGYEWTGPWEIDSTYVTCDRDGWTYAFDFSNFATMLLHDESHAKAGMGDYCRRRRWIRPRRRKQCPPPPRSPRHHSPSPRSRQAAAHPTDGDATVSDDDMPAPPPSLYRHFSPTMSMESHDAEWRFQLQTLDRIHTKLNHARAARVLRWKQTKAELRAQVKALLARPERHVAKIDSLKRAMWFPVEKGYIWRASLSGLFIGVHEFWMHAFSLSFSIALAPPATVALSFRGALRGRFDDVKIKGDKDTRIPNAKWAQLEMDVTFHGTWKLTHNDARDWTYVADQSKAIEFTTMNIQYRGGGLGVPDSLAQLILNEVVTNYIRTILAVSLPAELAKLVQTPTSAIEMAGEIVIDGLDLTTVDGAFNASDDDDTGNKTDQLQHVLGLSRPQLNLLLLTRQYIGLDVLFPSLGHFTTYLRKYALDARADDKDVETLTRDWALTWDRILELLFLQRQLNPRGRGVNVAPIEFAALVAHAKIHALEKQLPVRIHVSKLKCRVHLATMLGTLSAWLTQATRVAATLGASVMGIRIGRKDRSKRGTAVAPTEVPPAMLDIQRLLGYAKAWLDSGVLQHMQMDVEGKLTALPQDHDALIRMQARAVELVAAGPMDWTSSLGKRQSSP
ncbi:Aste57867_13269 [Aphanomyces stellatus]|uniref:Aste57867_13269 protein n=1 Tax=Aphanomyces stellatus TaxID=120398 RepID=A0A485KXP7_9STRA|nr:hypothetical protein As57867_013220 [Aphanomyces stellatus]VFT90109.1 Aste57867_13269 [Aphanomyces stellatus]